MATPHNRTCRMTILWIYNMPLIPEAGGTERITSLVVKGLSERGYKCLGILEFKEGAKDMIYEGEKVEDLYSFLKDNHVDVVINQIAYATWLLRDFLDRGGRRWHSEGGRIISCLHFDPCNPSYKQLLKSQEKISLRVRLDIVKHTIFSSYYRRFKEQREGKVYNEIYDNSDVFLILSKCHKPYMQKVMRRKDYDKITAINNPLTFPCIATDRDLDKKNKTVLVCARMSEYHKRISLILKTWKRLGEQGITKGWTLKFVGEGPDLERYKKYVKDNGIDNAIFYGQQSPLPFYEEASVLLLTSSAEGWGLVLTEALQNGAVPVVMNSSPVYSDIIDNSYNGYLTPDGNIKVFARHLKSLLTDSRRMNVMQHNALVSAHKFTIDKTIDQWEAIL